MLLSDLPPLMQKRHILLHSVFNALGKRKSGRGLFDFKQTIHADLELHWMDPNVQDKLYGRWADYQIVMARLARGQKTRLHFHEKGTSSFVVTSEYMGFSRPDIIYRSRPFEGLRQAQPWTEIRSPFEKTIDIFPYQVHQFENKGQRAVYILIVTNPIISLENGHEDIHFVDE
jgi:hypothetical protein